ncbi:MAG: hypothetical protein GY706_10180, partial [Bacteroides sp.]|nr:hypothetical protein [Bacteroides sp.]
LEEWEADLFRMEGEKMTSLKGLQRIFRKRLPDIDRWRKVTVYNWDGAPYFITPQDGMFYVVWSGPKRKNIHPYEYREIPLDDIEIIATRNRMRLRNKTKTYR